jgi:NADH:ubiquinone reductase (non-electrogenic)
MNKLLKVGLLAGSTVVAVKSVSILMNDDLGDVKYDIKKFYNKITASTTERVRREERVRPKVVVLGSGWAALSFIQHLDKDEIDLTVVSPRSFFFYTPLLAGACTGTVSQTAIAESIRWYCPHGPHSRFLQGECLNIDPRTQTLSCRASGDVELDMAYDYLIVAVGADTADFGIPGVREHSVPMKEIEHGAAIQRAVLEKLESANALLASAGTTPGSDAEARLRKELRWVIIGGGPSGVELSAELSDFINTDVARYFPHLRAHIQLTLVEATPRLLPVFDAQISAYTADMLREGGAEVLCDTMVTRITADAVEVKKPLERTADGAPATETIPCGLAVWAGGIKCKPITQKIRDSVGAPEAQHSRHGLVVDGGLKVLGLPPGGGDGSVFALGDCAVSGCAPTAQVAYQQGTYLGRRFRDSVLSAEQPKSEYPSFSYVHRGSLAYIGSSRGVADLKPLLWEHYPDPGRGGLRVEGGPAFLIWRSLYFTKLMSGRNKLQVAGDWLKTWLCGRDISSLKVLPPTQKGSEKSKKD